MLFLKPIELFSIWIILADFYVNIADDELCYCVRVKELICKFFSYIFYIILYAIFVIGRRFCYYCSYWYSWWNRVSFQRYCCGFFWRGRTYLFLLEYLGQGFIAILTLKATFCWSTPSNTPTTKNWGQTKNLGPIYLGSHRTKFQLIWLKNGWVMILSLGM